MSYVRFGPNSSVYVFMHVDGFLECCGCLVNDECIEIHSTAGMVAHLREHIAEGHALPDHVIPAIEADDASNFPAVTS